jgi:RNA polymerase sigma-70 factor (ECF subfamily)
LDNRDEAEDVVEETFWQFWQRASLYNGASGSILGWLLAIGRRKALDRLRAKQHRKGESVQARAESAIAAASSDAAREGEGGDRRQAVVNALRALPSTQQRAIELAFYGGLNQAEIAEYLGQPLEVVKAEMRAGMEDLRDKFGYIAGSAL